MRLFFLIVACLCSFTCFSQAPTTYDEWNYATNGYPKDAEVGRDPSKSGYTFEEVFTYDNGTINITFMEMKKGDEVRVTIIRESRRQGVDFYAIPRGELNREMEKKYNRMFNTDKIPSPRFRVLMYALNEYRLKGSQ